MRRRDFIVSTTGTAAAAVPIVKQRRSVGMTDVARASASMNQLVEADDRQGGHADRSGPEPSCKPLRQVVESVNETFKGQLDLERHHGRTPVGVVARVMQRILTLTTAIWHNDQSGQPVLRSLTTYDH